MAKKHKRFYKFKRSHGQDRSFLDWCGARKEPSVTEGLTHVETFLPELVEDIGLRDGITIDVLQNAWFEIVGENIANNSEPIEIYEGKLKVRVTQPVLKFELIQRKGQILELVQSKIPKAKVKQIEIMI